MVSDVLRCGIMKFYKPYVTQMMLFFSYNRVTFWYLKFPKDKFHGRIINFLDSKISVDGIDDYHKKTHTGQCTHFSNFEPFPQKNASVKLFHFKTGRLIDQKLDKWSSY